MATSPLTIFVTILALVGPLLVVSVNTNTTTDGLTFDFYKSKCPNVEKIIMDVAKKSAPKNPGWVPGILRTYFHDCFISGCDASVLLKTERYNSFSSELAHPFNRLRGIDPIDTIKAEVEKQCPGVVSCADILAYAARDAAVMAGNTDFKMPAGRRDSGFVDGNLAAKLPAGNFNTKDLIRLYEAKGLTVEDMVVLEGVHSIGESKCSVTIAADQSLANVTGAAEMLNKEFKALVTTKYCPKAKENNFGQLHVPLMPDQLHTTWGASFFRNIIEGKGVLASDLPFAEYPSTKNFVYRYANDHALWMNKFGEAMIKLGKLHVLTGEQGEIRRHCGYLNSVNQAVPEHSEAIGEL